MEQSTMFWHEVLSIFLFLAGFVLGLGSVTVIDWHAFLARKSAYWTKATIQTHKITKPLIWVGIFSLIAGYSWHYSFQPISSIFVFQAILITILVLNGLFLTFYVSPYLLKKEAEGQSEELLSSDWQKKIALSFIASFLCWWGALFLQAWMFAVKM